MHNYNDRSFLSVYDSTCSDYGNFIDPVVVSPLYVHTSTSFDNNPDIVSSNSTLGSSVNDSTFGLGGLSGWDFICHRYCDDLTVNDLIHIDFLMVIIAALCHLQLVIEVI